MRVLLVLRSLDCGGVERQAVNLATGLRQRGHDVLVMAMFGGTFFRADLDQAGVPVRSLGLRGRWDLVRLAWRSFSVLRSFRPSVVHGFHTESNLLCLWLARLASRPAAVWGIRTSAEERLAIGMVARLALRIERRLSGWTDLIIANSHVGAREAVEAGLDAERLLVIENGVRTDSFRPDAAARARTRALWGLRGVDVIGMVARLAPQKDHETFLRAAALFVAGPLRPHFICVGDGPIEYRRGLERRAEELGLAGSVTFTGALLDMPAVYNALDVATLVSIGEGTSNAIAEAMACGVRCVVADSGDLARCVGNTGIVLPARTPEQLVAAWRRMLEDGGTLAAPRPRILELYGLDAMLDRTEAALERVAAAAPLADQRPTSGPLAP